MPAIYFDSLCACDMFQEDSKTFNIFFSFAMCYVPAICVAIISNKIS